MPIKNTREQWGTISKALHWVVVALILVMAWIGLRMGVGLYKKVLGNVVSNSNPVS